MRSGHVPSPETNQEEAQGGERKSRNPGPKGESDMSLPIHLSCRFGMLILLLLLAACQLQSGDEASRAETATATVVATETEGARLAGVTVQDEAGNILGRTDAEGALRLSVARDQWPRALLLRKPGYATQVVPVVDTTDGVELHATLKRRAAPVKISDPANGFVVSGAAGSRVQLPQNGLVYEDNGEVVTEPVKVFVTPVDVTGDGAGGFPGAFAGVPLGSGEAAPIMSYGTMEVHFETASGREVNLAPGVQASIDIPIFVDLHPDGTPIRVGDSGQAVWYLDEATGIWKQASDNGVVVASMDSPTGLALQVSVSHFTWWNHDIAPQTCRRSIRVLDMPGQPPLGNPAPEPAPGLAPGRLTVGARIVADQPVSTGSTWRPWRPAYAVETIMPYIGHPISLNHKLYVFARELILPAKMPLKIKSLFRDEDGNYYRARYQPDTFREARDLCDPDVVDKPIELHLQPLAAEIYRFRALQIEPVWGEDGNGNPVVVANDVHLYWRVTAAEGALLTTPDGTLHRVRAVGALTYRVQGSEGDVFHFNLHAANYNGGEDKGLDVAYVAQADPQIVDPWYEAGTATDSVVLAWTDVRGASRLEWGYVDADGKRYRLGELESPHGAGQTPDFVPAAEAVQLYLRAVNGDRDSVSRLFYRGIGCDADVPPEECTRGGGLIPS